MIRAHAHFGRSDRERLQEWYRHQRHLMQVRHDKQRKQQKADDDVAEADLIALAITLATSEQISTFTVRLDKFDQRLDTYHEASVEALLEANEQLDLVRERLKQVRTDLDIMRKDAFELEDGTSIFLSEDETWAIDIEGNEIDIETVPIELMSPEAKIANEYLKKLGAENALVSQEDKLEQKIDAIHEFDQKRAEMAERSGDIRTELEGGDITTEKLEALEAELDAMDAELLEVMPPSVQARMNGVTPGITIPNVNSEFGEKARHGTSVSEGVAATVPTSAPGMVAP